MRPRRIGPNDAECQLAELLAADVPDSARRHLEQFRKERVVRAGVEGEWKATSWLSEDVMLGGHTGETVRIGGAQVHPATIHWADGWVRVLGDGGTKIDAVAEAGLLDITIEPPGPAVITIGVLGLDPAALHDTEWELPVSGSRSPATCSRRSLRIRWRRASRSSTRRPV